MNLVEKIKKLPYVKSVDGDRMEIYTKWGYDMSELHKLLKKSEALGWLVIVELEDEDINEINDIKYKG